MTISIQPVALQSAYSKQLKSRQTNYQPGLKTDISFKSKLGWRVVDMMGIGLMLKSGEVALAEMSKAYESVWGITDGEIKKIALAGVGILLGALVSTNALNNFIKSKN